MHVVPVVSLPMLGVDHDDSALTPDAFLPDQFVDYSTTMQVELVRKEMPFVDASESPAPQYVKSWDKYVGQEPMKNQLKTYIADAERRLAPLPHVLLASGMPGAGKTTLAELIAKEMGGRLRKMVPPFTPQTLYDAAMQMGDWEFLFIDEIHKLKRDAAENLLHMMEEKVLYLDDGMHRLADFTVIGATTDADKLPEAVVDRFEIKPYFQKYSLAEMVRITKNFADFFDLTLSPETMVAIAKASRRTPRAARDLVKAAQALSNADGVPCGPRELLRFAEVEPDGLTRAHRAYILAMFQFFGRERDGEWEYVAGEASLMTILRENKPGVARLERFLIEVGLVDRTPSGRRLTPLGVVRAQSLMRRGEGLSTE